MTKLELMKIWTNKKLTIFSWSVYDFANTIFAMNVISLYFALWVTVDMKGEDILYSLALSGSMLLVAISSPIMGTMSDRVGRRMPFLILFTFNALLPQVSGKNKIGRVSGYGTSLGYCGTIGGDMFRSNLDK